MARRFLPGVSKYKRLLVIKRGSVSIRSFIEHLALRDGKINKILTLLFGNLCPVKGGPHATIIISHRHFNRSISCAMKKKWVSLPLPESLSRGSHVFIKSLHLPCPALVRVSLLFVFYQGHPIFWYFPIASRMNDIPHPYHVLQRSSGLAPAAAPASGLLAPQTCLASSASFSWDSLRLPYLLPPRPRAPLGLLSPVYRPPLHRRLP